jgi:hypothetical protein
VLSSLTINDEHALDNRRVDCEEVYNHLPVRMSLVLLLVGQHLEYTRVKGGRFNLSIFIGSFLPTWSPRQLLLSVTLTYYSLITRVNYFPGGVVV